MWRTWKWNTNVSCGVVKWAAFRLLLRLCWSLFRSKDTSKSENKWHRTYRTSVPLNEKKKKKKKGKKSLLCDGYLWIVYLTWVIFLVRHNRVTAPVGQYFYLQGIDLDAGNCESRVCYVSTESPGAVFTESIYWKLPLLHFQLCHNGTMDFYKVQRDQLRTPLACF